MNFIAVTGQGNPNEKDGAYQKALSQLYTIAYTLKMSYKTDYRMEGFFEYVVPPLEGFWYQEGIVGVDYTSKNTFHWISVIRIPDFVQEKDVKWAKQKALDKKKQDCSDVHFRHVEEGLCVQIMHIGPFDDEPETVKQMDDFITENGYVNDMENGRLHHEIYLSDFRRTAPEKLETVIRHPIRKL